ncbi:MAG: hypothetical protein M0R77_12890 [Gammaproteobacteria bacterium]|nr:hypothetical protein [Gammaproteobacteria bacterium]
MSPGYYVGRRTNRNNSGKFVIVESRPFTARSDSEDDQWRAKRDAAAWGRHIKNGHPKDEVFIFEVTSLEDFEKIVDDG